MHASLYNSSSSDLISPTANIYPLLCPSVIFALYDFDESAVLTLDEMVLAFRSTLSGLSKLSNVDPPSEAEIELIVVQGFDAIRDEKNGHGKNAEAEGIDGESFVNYCLNTPEVLSWIEYYDDLEEVTKDFKKLASAVIEPTIVPFTAERLACQEAVMSSVLGGLSRLEFERKGNARDFLPRQSWQNVVPFLTPSRPSVQSDAFTPQTFQMEWVYGYNAHTSRHNLYYVEKGNITYAAGAVCIIQDVLQKTQKYFTMHTDLVTCLKVFHTSPGVSIVASGEYGRRPAVHIWDSGSRDLICTIQGFHRRGIRHIDMSPDHTKIVIMGSDKYHSVTVDHWSTKQRLWAGRSTVEEVHDLRFLSPTLIGAVGCNHFTFFAQNKSNDNGYTKYRGLFGGSVTPENLWCVAAMGNLVVTGSTSGRIFVWEGRNLIDSIKGHSSPIQCCHVLNTMDDLGLVTGCTGGKVIIWTSKLEVGAVFNVAALGTIEPAIVSVCWDKANSKILLGFKSCEIFEIDSFGGRNCHTAAVVCGHYSSNVTGLAVHPMNPRLVCTVSDDKTVRVFDSELHKQIRSVKLDTPGKCCAYSSDAQLILVGFGSARNGMEERKDGAYVILSEEDLTIVYESRDSRYSITACRFSPNGELYALASADGTIYIYKSNGFEMKVICRGHTGKVSHIDFSQDSRFIMTNSTAGEVMFWDSSSGEAQTPKIVKELKWATNSCVYSYATQGFWGPYDDKVQCLNACRSNARDVMAVVDSCGQVRVSNAPCLKDSPTVRVLCGHAAEAQACEFSCDDGHLFSVGSRDGTLIQWGSALDTAPAFPDTKKGESISDDIAVEIQFHGKKLERTKNAENVLNDIPVALCMLEEGSAESMGLQPWQRTIVAPSLVPFEDASEPSDCLELEFIYGFTADKTRQSILYSTEGEIIFFAGSVVVLMDQLRRTQRFYTCHQASICAIATTSDENGSLIASSDILEAPTIRIWNSNSLETLAVLQGYHRRGVCHLKFSSNGTHIASVGLDRMHSWALYDWRNNQILSSSQGFPNRSLCIDFSPKGTEMLQCGNGMIRFWNIREKNLSFQDAILGARAKVQAFLCIGWIGNNAIIGTDDGSLYRFNGRQLDGIIPAHTGSVTAIASCSEGVCSCSSDGFLKIWTKILDCRISVDFRTFPVTSRNLRCVSWINSHICVGTSYGEIIEIDSTSGENLHSGVLLQGHGGEELWGLSVNPLKDQFCSVGEDAFLRIWDLISHNCVVSIQLEMAARCCCYSPDGTRIAVGFGSPHQTTNKQYDGKWVVLDSEDFQVIHEARDSTAWLSEAKYAPNSELLAFGSSNGKILVYSVLENYSLSATISQHNARITSIDFSDDSRWMQSSCAAFELCYFEADTGMFLPAASRLKDTVWSTQHCPLGWSVQGIWPPQSDGTECTACESNLFRTGDGSIIVSGDSYGSVSLYRSPCVSAFAVGKKYRVSSNPVTRIRFCAGDATLLSLSAADKVIVQWSHKRDRGQDVAWDVVARRGALVAISGEDDEDVARLVSLVTGGPDNESSERTLTDILATNNVSKPWLAAMVPPSKLGGILIDPTPPTEKIEKYHVFGLECLLSRGSVRFNSDGDFVFSSSKYVIVFNKKKNSQIIYHGHSLRNVQVVDSLLGLSATTSPDGIPINKSDAIVCCVSTSSDGKLVASATQCNRPNIHIWDANSCVTLCVLQLVHRRGVVSMQFSPDRKRFVSVGSDQDHSIALWESPSANWSDGRLLACSKGDTLPVMFACFYSTPEAPQEYLLVSGGKYHVKFWNVDGRCLNSSYPEHDSKEKLGTLLCGTTCYGNFLAGSSTGGIFVWKGRKLLRTVRAHETPVTCLWSESSVGVLSAGKDGVIKVWTSAVKHVKSFALSDADVPPISNNIRSLDSVILVEKIPKGPSKRSIKRVLVSTDSGEIYEISGKSGSITLVHEAHYTGQLYGLCVHPLDSDLFATCGDDQTVRVWSISQRRLVRKAVLDCTARSIGWSCDGRNLLIGMGGSADNKRQKKDGAWLMLNATTLKPEFEGR